MEQNAGQTTYPENSTQQKLNCAALRSINVKDKYDAVNSIYGPQRYTINPIKDRNETP